MHQFFVLSENVGEKEIMLKGQDVRHMKNVLRLKPSDEVCICDGDNRRYLCTIVRYGEDQAVLNICEKLPFDMELPAKVYLFQGLPKQEKMEWIIQKCVELGVFAIVPITMHRCVVKLNERKEEKRLKRWMGISESAAKQAGRGIIPEIMPVMSYMDAAKYAKGLDMVLFPYENEEGMEHTKAVFQSIKPGMSVGIFIGPEGGFEPDEINIAEEIGGHRITLGRRILRTETAGMAILSILMFLLEE